MKPRAVKKAYGLLTSPDKNPNTGHSAARAFAAYTVNVRGCTDDAEPMTRIHSGCSTTGSARLTLSDGPTPPHGIIFVSVQEWAKIRAIGSKLGHVLT
jgi:hypothetical protein